MTERYDQRQIKRKFIFDVEGIFDSDPDQWNSLLSTYAWNDEIIIFRFDSPCLRYFSRVAYPQARAVDRATAWNLLKKETFRTLTLTTALDCNAMLSVGGPIVETDDLRPFICGASYQFRTKYAASEISAARRDGTFFFPRHFKIMGDHFFLREYGVGRRSELLLIEIDAGVLEAPGPAWSRNGARLTNYWEQQCEVNLRSNDIVALCAGTAIAMQGSHGPALPTLPSGDQIFEDEET